MEKGIRLNLFQSQKYVDRFSEIKEGYSSYKISNALTSFLGGIPHIKNLLPVIVSMFTRLYCVQERSYFSFYLVAFYLFIITAKIYMYMIHYSFLRGSLNLSNTSHKGYGRLIKTKV